MSIKNIRSLGFAKGLLHKGKDLDKVIDIVKATLDELGVSYADTCCFTNPPPGGGDGGNNSLFFDNGDCIAIVGSGSEANPFTIFPIISEDPTNALSCTENGLYVPESDIEITNIENIINNFIEDTFDGTYLIDGGQITWISDYNYTVSAANYLILGESYNSPETDITLDAADPTDDRIDLVVVNDSGAVEVITGTPDPNPAEPSYDPETQIPLAFITVNAATTQPPCALTAPVYTDNLGIGGGEFTVTSSSGTINVNSSSNPRTGTKDIEATNVVANATLTLTPGGPVDFSTITQLNMYIRSKGTWAGGGNKRLVISLRNGSTQVGTALTIQPTGTWGFNSATTGVYQKVSLPTLSFNIPVGVLITSIRIRVTGAKTGVGFYIDDINIENNCSIIVSGPGLTVDADNGLTVVNSLGKKTIELGATTAPGSPLLHTSYISTGAFGLRLSTSTAAINPFSVTSTTGHAIIGTATGGDGLQGASTSGSGVTATSTSGSAFAGTSISGAAADLFTNPSSTNSITKVANFYRLSSGTAAAGLGGSLDLYLQNATGGGHIANRIIWKWLDATLATYKSQLEIWGSTGGAAPTNLVSITGDNIVGIGVASPSTATRLQIADNTLGAKSMIYLSTTSTAAATDLQKLLEISLTGANVTASQKTYGIYVSNAHTGTTPTNYGIYSFGTTYGIWGENADGVAIYGNATNAGIGVNGASISGTGLQGQSSSSFGLNASSLTGVAGQLSVNPSSTNTQIPVLQVVRTTSGTAANNIGGSIDFYTQTVTNNANLSNRIISQWLDATFATRTSQISITGINNTATSVLLTISGAGIFTLVQGLQAFADDAAAAAGSIPVNGLYRTASAIKIRVS